MTKRKLPWKPAVKIITLCVIFAVASVALAVLLSLIPDSGKLSPWITLGLPLALAWLVAAGLGTNIVTKKQSLALATICLLVAAPIAWYGPWGGGAAGNGAGNGELPGDSAQAGEVLFKYEASFTYRGSEENIPLMGYFVLFPCPTVDGEPAIKQENMRWQLWGPIEGENGARWLELEVDNNNVFQWVGERANSPPDNDFYWGWYGNPSHKPWLGYLRDDYGVTWKVLIQGDFDNLYPGEMLKSIGSFSVPAEKANRVTLEEDNEIVRQENGLVLARNVIGYMGMDVGGEIKIDLSYRVQLFKKIDNDFVVIKNYSRVEDNAPNSRWPNVRWLELLPT